MHSKSLVEVHQTWPQHDAETSLQPGDDVQVRPRVAFEDRGYRVVVDSGESLDRAVALVSDSCFQVQYKLTRNLTAVVRRGHVRPLLRTIPRSQAGRAWHTTSVDDGLAVAE